MINFYWFCWEAHCISVQWINKVHNSCEVVNYVIPDVETASRNTTKHTCTEI